MQAWKLAVWGRMGKTPFAVYLKGRNLGKASSEPRSPTFCPIVGLNSWVSPGHSLGRVPEACAPDKT